MLQIIYFRNTKLIKKQKEEKMKSKHLLLLVVSLFLITSFVSAEDEATDMMYNGPMGQPEEMKALSWMVGDWDVTQEWKMDPAADTWEKSAATATYSYSLDGCILMMDYSSDMMGMPFTGLQLLSYDRVLKQFQSLWVDNVSGRMSFYLGVDEGEQTVYTGEDVMPTGETILAKVVISNETEDSFDWRMDMSSDGGKTYLTTGKATYTKKK